MNTDSIWAIYTIRGVLVLSFLLLFLLFVILEEDLLLFAVSPPMRKEEDMPIDPENNVPLDAEQIAEMADAGKSISQFFTSPGVMKPGLKKQTR